MKRKIYLAGLILSVVMLFVSVFSIVHHYRQAEKATEQFDAIVGIVEQVDNSVEKIKCLLISRGGLCINGTGTERYLSG